MIFNDLLITLAIVFGINLLMFLPAYYFKTDKLTDISYSLTFVAVVLYGLIASGISVPNIVLATMTFIWALRLGGYLFVRIWKTGHDRRFDGRRENFRRFLSFWILQAVTVWVVLLPSTLFFSQDIQQFSNLAYIGIAIWLIGLLIETFADRQKYHFNRDPANQDKWIASGLWKYSRHPNYFGEMTLWVGIYIYTIFSVSLTIATVAIIGPIYLILLMYFISGVPILEKTANKRWADDPNYQAYKHNTNTLIPLPRIQRQSKPNDYH